MLRFLVALTLLLACTETTLHAKHRVLLQGGKRLAIVEADGKISWEMEWGGIHDIHLLKNLGPWPW